VVSLTQVLEVNWIILYFVYGQVFFVMGLVTGLQWRRRSDLELARPLPWLAAFGIAHGLNEWGHIFIPLQALYLDDPAVRLMVIAHLLLLALSYFFLLQFGIELILPLLPRQTRLRAIPAVVLILWGGAVFVRGVVANDSLSVLVAVGSGWARYILCFPGAILASIGLFHQAREMRTINLERIANYLSGAAVGFLVYAVVGGLIVPPSPVFPASLLNSTLLESTIRIPAPVFRSLCGLAMAFFVVRSLEVFQVETEQRLAEMEQEQLLAADRERIGRELHDGIIQKIYAAGLGLEEARYLVVEDPPQAQQRLSAIMGDLNHTIEDIRRYIFDLRTAEQTRELETVLANLVQDLRLDTMLEVDLEVQGHRCCWLPSEQVSHVTQIAREAFSNIVQHADASHVSVLLSYDGDATQLTVSDNGRGIAPDHLADDNPIGAARNGHGIDNMHARAHTLGGTLDLENQPGEGFRLVLTIPCDGDKGAELVAEDAEVWA
jgi:signal transduction histidine kinase